VSLVGELPFYSLSQNYTVGLPQGLLIPGVDYQFKYRAINIFGAGDFSDVSTIKAAMKPD